MAWKIEECDAITRGGARAKFIKYNDGAWPCPWVFQIEEEEGFTHYSVGGYKNNHNLNQHKTDLMGPYEVPKIAGRTKEEWLDFAKRDDCLEQMSSSDLRQLIEAIS